MKIFQKFAAEFLGTFILVGGSIGAVAGADSVLSVGLATGLAFMLALYALGGLAGGYFNPAVSLAMFLDRRIGFIDMLGYWVMQVAGAIAASALLAWVYTREFLGYAYPALQRGDGINELAGFFAEAVLTLVLVFAILVLAKGEGHAKYVGMGVALTVTVLVGYMMTGAGVNPARVFAPALLGGKWDGFWVFIAGPALGAIVAWALYKIIIEGDISLGDDVVAVKDSVVEETREVIDEID